MVGATRILSPEIRVDVDPSEGMVGATRILSPEIWVVAPT